MSTTVTYKGNTLTTVNNETRTLTTSGKYLEDDITLVDITSGGSGSGAVWQDQYGYVHLSDEGDIELQTKTVSPTESAQTVLADAGYYGLNRVNVSAIPSNYVGSGVTQRTSSDLTASGATVTAPSGYYASNATKTVASGSATPASTISATGATVSTGTNTLTLSKSVSNTPNVSAGYISSGTSGSSSVSLTASVNTRSSSDLTASGATVTAPSGYYASSATKTVASGTEGTPTATKGAVSNHAIAVTPSVTNTAGYITGSTKTGTAVSVSASELVSGTKSISANGTGIDVTNFASVDVAVGGGGSSDKKQINFIDYDGTILHSYTKTEWQSVSTLPSNPSHSGLTAQGWNWTKAQIDAQLTAAPDGDVWVGQMYITDDGKTRLYIHLEESRLHPYLGIGVNGTTDVDWGDNSATNTLTGTSLSTAKYADHTYAISGDYVITLTASSGSFTIFGVSNTSHILKKDTGTSANIHRVYAEALQKVEIGANAKIGNYAFNGCYSLESITIPNTVTSIGDYALQHCYSLESITIPNTVTSIKQFMFYNCFSFTSIAIPSGVTSIGNDAFSNCCAFKNITIPNTVTSIGNGAFNSCYAVVDITIPSGVTSIGENMFNGCYSLKNITIPSTVTSIGNNAFLNCRVLTNIAIPSGVTSIGNGAFNSCYAFTNITIPSTVTSIGSNAFSACHGVGAFHFKSTISPTLADTNAFNAIQSDCVIYVPSASLSDYQTATNWSTYASYMVGE